MPIPLLNAIPNQAIPVNTDNAVQHDPAAAMPPALPARTRLPQALAGLPTRVGRRINPADCAFTTIIGGAITFAAGTAITLVEASKPDQVGPSLRSSGYTVMAVGATLFLTGMVSDIVIAKCQNTRLTQDTLSPTVPTTPQNQEPESPV